jgi:hypothetical protein
MKMLVVVYGGPRPHLIPDLLDRLGVHGWTQLSNAHGAGSSGRREGTRAWPGDSQVIFSIVADESVGALMAALRGVAERAEPGERLHLAQLPVEQFV